MGLTRFMPLMVRGQLGPPKTVRLVFRLVRLFAFLVLVLTTVKNLAGGNFCFLLGLVITHLIHWSGEAGFPINRIQEVNG